MYSDFFLYALLTGALAVCWAEVLVEPEQVLAPVQAWLRAWYRRPRRRVVPINNPLFAGLSEFGPVESIEIDSRWWWAPLWGCYKCVAGQWALWGYAAAGLLHHIAYNPLHHLFFIALTIILAALWRGAYKWSQRQQ